MDRPTALRQALSSTKNHYFKRTFVDSINTDSAGQAGIGKSFRLDMLPNYTEFTTLFDQYRINGIAIKVVWRSTGISMIETQADPDRPGAPILYDVIDLDDATAPTTRNEVMSYSKHQMTMYSTARRSRSKFFKPRGLNTIYRTGVSNAYTLANPKAWIDMSYVDVEHYGYKGFVEVPNTGATSVPVNYFDIHYTVYLQCRQAR